MKLLKNVLLYKVECKHPDYYVSAGGPWQSFANFRSKDERLQSGRRLLRPGSLSDFFNLFKPVFKFSIFKAQIYLS